MKKKKQLKNKLLHSQSPRLQDQIQKTDKKKDKEVKWSARSDERSYILKMSSLMKLNKRLSEAR